MAYSQQSPTSRTVLSHTTPAERLLRKVSFPASQNYHGAFNSDHVTLLWKEQSFLKILLNLLGWHWLLKLYRFQAYNFKYIICMLYCVSMKTLNHFTIGTQISYKIICVCACVYVDTLIYTPRTCLVKISCRVLIYLQNELRAYASAMMKIKHIIHVLIILERRRKLVFYPNLPSLPH